MPFLLTLALTLPPIASQLLIWFPAPGAQSWVMVHPAPTLNSDRFYLTLPLALHLVPKEELLHFKVNPGQEEPNVSQDAERSQENRGEQGESSAFLHSSGTGAPCH